MAGVELRESVRQSILRIAAIADGPDLANESPELLEVREKQLTQYFRRFYDEHLKIVAEVDGVNNDARLVNQELLAEVEESYMLARAKLVRAIRRAQAAEFAEVEANRLAAIVPPAVEGNEQRQFEINQANVPLGERIVVPNPVAMGALIGHLAADANMGPQIAMDAQPPEEGARGGAVPTPYVRPNAAQLRQANQQRAYQNQFVVIVDNDHQINLPNFDGDLGKWIEFRDAFRQAVHERHDRTPISKFNTLMKHLSGDAMRVVAGMTRSADNYPIAWQMLIDQYEHPRLITQTLLAQLAELRPLSESNATGLRYVVLKYKQVLRQIEAQGYEVEAMAPVLTRDSMALLDRSMRFEWEKQHRTREPKPLSELLEFLEHQANCMIYASPASGSRRGESQPTKDAKRSRTTVGHVSAGGTPAEQIAVNAAEPSRCPVCKERCQSVAVCKQFLEFAPFRRQKVAKAVKLCFGCLKTDHGVNECQSPTCPHCTSGRQHHRLLCFAYYSQQQAQATGSTSSAVGLVRNEPVIAAAIHNKPETPGNDSNSSIDLLQFERQENPLAQIVMANQVSGALLATAIIRVRSINGEFKILRALCDTGAQTNLITERAVQLLAASKEQTNESLCPVGTADSLPTRGTVQVVLAPVAKDLQLFRIQIKAFVLKKDYWKVTVGTIGPGYLASKNQQQFGRPHSSGTWASGCFAAQLVIYYYVSVVHLLVEAPSIFPTGILLIQTEID